MKAHLASCAAGKQGKFVEFYKAFWEKAFMPYAQARDPSKLGEENFMAFSKELGIDTAKLKTDMEGPECQKLVQGDMQELSKFRVNGTPGFFINGEFVGGFPGKEGLKPIIDKKLALAERSGVPGNEYYEKEIMGKGEKTFRSKKQPKPH
jgi:protein-disulfide isomerase